MSVQPCRLSKRVTMCLASYTSVILAGSAMTLLLPPEDVIFGTRAGTEDPTRCGRLAFESNFEAGEPAHQDLYVMNPDGSDRRQLTHASDDESYLRPVWSPACSQIAFVKLWTKPEHRSRIYVMDADGTKVRPVGQPLDNASDWEPSWSPDSKELAFVSDRDGNPDIYVMRIDGSHVLRITRTLGRDKHILNPSWSPIGKTIAFDSNRSGVDEIYVVTPDSRGMRQLTHTTGMGKGNWTPDWSPDGKKIVFASNRDGTSEKGDEPSDYGIYMMEADGSHLRRLTNWDDAHPHWSPDGKRIVFEASRDGNKEGIYVMQADGTQIQRFTSTKNSSTHPDWCRCTPNPALKLKQLNSQ